MAEANHTSSDASEPPQPVLELRGVGKTFSGVHVLAGVDFSVRSGEVMGLVGENGAGKSTLMRIVTSIYDADPGGTIRFDGDEIHFTNTRLGEATYTRQSQDRVASSHSRQRLNGHPN